MSEWIDITLPIRADLPSWPGDPVIQLHQISTIGVDGADCNVTTMASTVHFGTHVDAPRHYLPQGETVDQLELGLLMGDAYVLDLSGTGRHVSAADLARVPEGVERLLLRTANSVRGYLGDRVFHTDYCGLLGEAAEELVRRGIRLVGLDYYSIGAMEESYQVHTAFLAQPKAIALEGIFLRDVPEGWYELVCLPLLMQGREGAACRALLRAKPC